MYRRRFRHWPLTAAIALALTWPVAAGGAATTRTARVPMDLLGVWHKPMTKAQWEHAGVTRDAGVYTFLVKKAGTVTIYKPGDYRPGCSACVDFTTTFRANGGRLTIGNVPVCSFEGAYSWHRTGRTLIVTPLADKRCLVRETFFGGRWKR